MDAHADGMRSLPAQMLEQLLDRTHMEQHRAPPYALTGVGYEVVNHAEGSGLLSGVE